MPANRVAARSSSWPMAHWVISMYPIRFLSIMNIVGLILISPTNSLATTRMGPPPGVVVDVEESLCKKWN